MKKTWMIYPMCAGILLSGCVKNGGSSITSMSTDGVQNVWHVSAGINATAITDLVPFSYVKIQQDSHEASVLRNIETTQMYNAILITNEDTQTLNDFDGNLLYTLAVNVSKSKNAEGIVQVYAQTDTEKNYMTEVFGTEISQDKAIYLKDDFKTAVEIDPDRLIYHPYDGDQYYDTLAIQNGKIGILAYQEDENGYMSEKLQFMEYTKLDLPDLFIATEIDEDCNTIDQVVCNRALEVISVVPNKIYERQSGTFVNEIYPVYQEGKEKQIALVDAKEGKEITEYKYTDVGYFSNGYCPVRNDEGKWAYINTSGEEVTDFIFDEASSLYEGKAWIVKDGKAGVINLQDALKVNEHLTDSIFDKTDSDVVTKDVEETEEEQVIGTVTILASSINIRKGAGTEYDTNGSVSESETYDVYQIEEKEDYTWYCIGEDKWIAGNDGWLTYKEK